MLPKPVWSQIYAAKGVIFGSHEHALLKSLTREYNWLNSPFTQRPTSKDALRQTECTCILKQTDSCKIHSSFEEHLCLKSSLLDLLKKSFLEFQCSLRLSLSHLPSLSPPQGPISHTNISQSHLALSPLSLTDPFPHQLHACLRYEGFRMWWGKV